MFVLLILVELITIHCLILISFIICVVVVGFIVGHY